MLQLCGIITAISTSSPDIILRYQHRGYQQLSDILITLCYISIIFVPRFIMKCFVLSYTFFVAHRNFYHCLCLLLRTRANIAWQLFLQSLKTPSLKVKNLPCRDWFLLRLSQVILSLTRFLYVLYSILFYNSYSIMTINHNNNSLEGHSYVPISLS